MVYGGGALAGWVLLVQPFLLASLQTFQAFARSGFAGVDHLFGQALGFAGRGHAF